MTKILTTVALALVIAGVGCAKRVDLDTQPIGAKVDLTRQDGGVVGGTLAARDDKALTITMESGSRVVPRDQIVAMQLVGDTAVPLPVSAKFREYTLREGTRLAVRLDSPVGSDSSRVEDPIEATLTAAVLVNGTEVLPAGGVVRGAVSAVASSGQVKGRGTLSLLFSSVSAVGSDERYLISARAGFLAASGRNKDIATIGIGAGGGALLGALFGGGKGALIGTAVGGGAGTAVALSTRGPQVHLPRGTALSLRLDQPVDIRVPIRKT